MKESSTKLPVNKPQESAEHAPMGAPYWHPIETLRHEMDRLFDDFNRSAGVPSVRRPGFNLQPFWRHDHEWRAEPAVDFAETDKSYEITAELPGLDEKDIEVKLANGGLSIRGEKQEEKEEQHKDYYVHERRFGSFERYFRMPDGVDRNKIEASFQKGILTVTLPKTPEARKAEKTIEVKAG